MTRTENLTITTVSGTSYLEDYGVKMGGGFISAILAPAGLKEFVRNETRLSHGAEYVVSNPRFAERKVSLSFSVQGEGLTAEARRKSFCQRMNWLIERLGEGSVSFSAPCLNTWDGSTEVTRVFRLIFTGTSITYNQNRERSFAILTASFVEPDPTNRSVS